MKTVLFALILGLIAQTAFADDYIQRRHKELDRLQELHELKVREGNMCKAGVLPPAQEKRVSGFVYRGRLFRSFEEFRGSPEHIAMIEDRLLDERVTQNLAQLEYENAGLFLKEWNKMTPLGRLTWTERRHRQDSVKLMMGDAWYQKYGKVR